MVFFIYHFEWIKKIILPYSQQGKDNHFTLFATKSSQQGKENHFTLFTTESDWSTHLSNDSANALLDLISTENPLTSAQLFKLPN